MTEVLEKVQQLQVQLQESKALALHYRENPTDASAEELKKLRTQLKTADDRLRAAADAAHKKQQEIDQIKSELDRCKATSISTTQITQLNAKITQLENEKKALQTKLNVEGNRYSQIFDQFEEAKRQLQEQIEKKEELAGKVTEQSTNIQTLTKKKEELEGKLLETSRELSTCKTQLATPTGSSTLPKLTKTVKELRKCVADAVVEMLRGLEEVTKANSASWSTPSEGSVRHKPIPNSALKEGHNFVEAVNYYVKDGTNPYAHDARGVLELLRDRDYTLH